MLKHSSEQAIKSKIGITFPFPEILMDLIRMKALRRFFVRASLTNTPNCRCFGKILITQLIVGVI